MRLPQFHRIKNQLYRLEGNQCQDCKQKFFPPRAVCPTCHSKQLVSLRFCGLGEIYSFTRENQPPKDFTNQGPYPIALVKLEEGILVLAQLTDVDYDQIEIGMKVEMVIRKIREYGEKGLIVYGYKFRPLLCK